MISEATPADRFDDILAEVRRLPRDLRSALLNELVAMMCDDIENDAGDLAKLLDSI